MGGVFVLLFIDIDQTFWIGRRWDTWIQRGEIRGMLANLNIVLNVLSISINHSIVQLSLFTRF